MVHTLASLLGFRDRKSEGSELGCGHTLDGLLGFRDRKNEGSELVYGPRGEKGGFFPSPSLCRKPSFA